MNEANIQPSWLTDLVNEGFIINITGLYVYGTVIQNRQEIIILPALGAHNIAGFGSNCLAMEQAT